jgi:hypothetical protein
VLVKGIEMRAVVSVGLALLVTIGSGCGSGPDPEEAANEVTSSRDAVVDALRIAAKSAAGVGSLGRATGRYAVCGSPPAEAVEYRASVLVQAGQHAAAVPAITDRLADDGWEILDEGSDPDPWSNMERDGVTGSVRVDPMQGSTALVLAVAGPCVSVAEGQTSKFELSEQQLDLT